MPIVAMYPDLPFPSLTEGAALVKAEFVRINSAAPANLYELESSLEPVSG